MYAVPPVVLLLGQNKNVTQEHFQSLRLICNGAGPVKQADGERILARSKNKNLRFCQGKTLFYPPELMVLYIHEILEKIMKLSK